MTCWRVLCLLAAFGAADIVMGGDRMNFSVTEQDGVWWFVGPDGNKFLSKGVDCVGVGVSAEKYDPAKPEYSAERHLGESFEKWMPRTLDRFQAWGFNTIGGWSDERLIGARAGLPITPVLHLGIQASAPWWDMWTEEYEKKLADLAEKLTAPYRGKPGVLGYFLDNEFGWGDEYFISIALGWKPKMPGKQLLVKTLRELYRDDFAAFTADFTTKAEDWDRLAEDVKIVRKAGKGHAAIDAWLFVVARRYYESCSAAVRKLDPGALILGDRFQQFCPQPVARGARGILDVISTNFEAKTSDGWISPAYFHAMHELSGLPVIIGEFYATSRQNRSGNRNSGDYFTLVDTQEERAAVTATQVESFVAFPFVVGWHWFQFCDEPTFGRGDGEDYNMGLVDIYDEPYTEMTEAFTRAHGKADRMHRLPKQEKVSRPLAVLRQEGLLADGKLGEWDKTRPVPRGLLSAPGHLVPFGDVFLAWDSGNLWAAIRPYDFSLPGPETTARHDRATWGELHRIKLEVDGFKVEAATGLDRGDGKPENEKPVLYAAPPPQGLPSAAVSSHVDKWFYVWEIAVPARALKRDRLKKGDRLQVELEIENRGDFERMTLGLGGQGVEIVLR